MKKLLALLLVFTMLFALVACGGSENGGNGNTPEAAVRKWFNAMYKDFDAEAACSYTVQYNKDLGKYLNDDADVEKWESGLQTAKEQFESRISSIKEMFGENGSFTIDKIEQIDVIQTQGDNSSVIRKAQLSDFSESIDAIAEIRVTATLNADSYSDTDEDTVYVALIDGNWYMSFN